MANKNTVLGSIEMIIYTILCSRSYVIRFLVFLFKQTFQEKSINSSTIAFGLSFERPYLITGLMYATFVNFTGNPYLSLRRQ